MYIWTKLQLDEIYRKITILLTKISNPSELRTSKNTKIIFWRTNISEYFVFFFVLIRKIFTNFSRKKWFKISRRYVFLSLFANPMIHESYHIWLDAEDDIIGISIENCIRIIFIIFLKTILRSKIQNEDSCSNMTFRYIVIISFLSFNFLRRIVPWKGFTSKRQKHCIAKKIIITDTLYQSFILYSA